MNTKKRMSSKSVFKLIKGDVFRGFYYNRFRYVLVLLMITGIIVMMASRQFGMLDTVFFLQGGYEAVDVIKNGKITFPYIWMAIQFLVAFMVFNYCNDDCEGVGVDVLIKCKSRGLWWISKCIWNALTVISVYIIEYVVAFFFGVHNKSLDGTINYALFKKMSNKNLPDNQESIYIIIYLMLVPLLVSIAVSLLQMTISIAFNPIIGILVVMALMVLSAFFCNPVMIGNVSMVMRSSVYNAGKIKVWKGLCVCILTYVICFIAGILMFRKRDILQKEGEE